MSKQFWPSIGPVTGTWFDIPQQSSRVYVPFGKTRLNRIGLFYFRNHHWRRIEESKNRSIEESKNRRIEESLDFVRLVASEKTKWTKIPDGMKVFIERV